MFRTAMAVCASLVTLVIVYAVKRGTEWVLSQLNPSFVIALACVTLPPLWGYWIWAALLRPLIQKRKQRESGGLAGVPVRQLSSD